MANSVTVISEIQLFEFESCFVPSLNSMLNFNKEIALCGLCLAQKTKSFRRYVATLLINNKKYF